MGCKVVARGLLLSVICVLHQASSQNLGQQAVYDTDEATEEKIINEYEYLPGYLGLVLVGKEQDDQDHQDRVLRSDHHVRVMKSDYDSPPRIVRQDHHMRVMRGE